MKLDAYYTRMVREIRERDRGALGTGGDVSILLSIIDHLLKEDPPKEAVLKTGAKE